MTDKKNKNLFINGPVNTIRIEGNINNKKKVLYMFGDIHELVEYQTQCDDIRSIELKNYLADNFDSITGTGDYVDFFLEIYPSSIIDPNSQYKGKYIWDLQAFFKSNISFDLQKNKINKSKEFPNVRFHYIDIRDYLEYNSYDIFNNISNTIIKNMHLDLYVDIGYLKDSVVMASVVIFDLFEYIFKEKRSTANIKVPPTVNSISKYTKEDILKKNRKFIDKILNNYSNTYVQEKIVNIVNNDLYNMYVKYFKILSEFDDYLQSVNDIFKRSYRELYYDKKKNTYEYGGVDKESKRDIINKIDNLFQDLFLYFIDLNVLLVDMYFLRRFLDKDVISNGIVYTGIGHTYNYLYYLVKYFDFKITNSSFIKEEPTKVEKLIKSSKTVNGLENLIFPPILKQCSNLSGFPHNFK